MKKISKNIFLIISIYLIHLLIYIGMVYIINTNIANWNHVVNKLKINSNIDSYTHLYVHTYYFILSTYFMLKCKIPMNKIVKAIVFIIAYVVIIIGLYRYYDIKYFLQMISIATGLILTINMIYNKLNMYKC